MVQATLVISRMISGSAGVIAIKRFTRSRVVFCVLAICPRSAPAFSGVQSRSCLKSFPSMNNMMAMATAAASIACT